MDKVIHLGGIRIIAPCSKKQKILCNDSNVQSRPARLPQHVLVLPRAGNAFARRAVRRESKSGRAGADLALAANTGDIAGALDGRAVDARVASVRSERVNAATA